MYTLDKSIHEYRPAIRLTAVFSRTTLRRVHWVTLGGLTICYTGYFASLHVLDGAYQYQLLGGGLVFTSLWLEQFLTFVYHNSHYYRGLNSIIGLEDEPVSGATYEVAEATLKRQEDMTRAFIESDLGRTVMLRSGLTIETINTYLESNRRKLPATAVQLPEERVFTLIELGKYLLTHDPSFATLLKENGVREELFVGAMNWVIGGHIAKKRTERWWSKDNLSRTQGIGQGWAYGVAYHLQKFTRDIRTSAVFSTLTNHTPFAEEKIADIESALAKDQAANVLIIGEPGVGKMDLVMAVQNRIKTGKALDAIAGKHIFVLDTNRLMAVYATKQDLEVALIEMCQESLNAGNTIIAIENFSTFLREAESIGVHVPELLDEYLALPQLQFVATDTPGNYHQYLETLGAFTRRFVEVLIDTPELGATTRLLQDIALAQEAKHGVLFTYAGLHAVSVAADRYIVDGVMPDKAVDLLLDVASAAREQQLPLITEDFVYQVTSDKTGVPAGPIQDEEREQLLHLEDKLHRQVIGQEAALSAIARTMRRARTGIQDAERPIGSFLFLGPTGVGKTETAKALAKIFFGGEDKLQRLDMSEYSGEAALEQLIGTNERAGSLANLLREHPYSVVLLDEFEKAHHTAHDLFLQVLDEGHFTDGRGQSINARNCIIIATSNAGSDLIQRTVAQRKDIDHLNSKIIDHIIKEGIYRPELINRFDNTIIFEPLTMPEQTQVAGLMLHGLHDRIEEKGYQLELANDLVTLLAEKGYDPEFGARPMQRVMQDILEEKIAQLIIAGKVQKGDTITLSASDFSEAELAVVD